MGILFVLNGEVVMNENDLTKSLNLPKRPFLRGIARLVDFGGSLDRELLEEIRGLYAFDDNPTDQSSTEPGFLSEHDGWKADGDAIRAVWKAVGDDMRWAIQRYESELAEK